MSKKGPLVLLVVIALAGAALWKLGAVERLISRLHIGSESVQEIASPLVLLRPKHLPVRLKNGDVALAHLLATQPGKDELVVKISKSKYKLSLVYKGNVIKEYPVVFGPDPVNDKLQEGDKRTPEGKFKVRDMYPHQSWSKFIWLDYPNAGRPVAFRLRPSTSMRSIQ